MQDQFKYQLVLTAFKRNETINSNSLIEILGKLPLVIATILEKERIEANRIIIDDDIPF